MFWSVRRRTCADNETACVSRLRAALPRCSISRILWQPKQSRSSSWDSMTSISRIAHPFLVRLPNQPTTLYCPTGANPFTPARFCRQQHHQFSALYTLSAISCCKNKCTLSLVHCWACRQQSAFLLASTGKVQAHTGQKTCQPVHLAAVGVHLESCPTNCMAEVRKKPLAQVVLCSIDAQQQPFTPVAVIASRLSKVLSGWLHHS